MGVQLVGSDAEPDVPAQLLRYLPSFKEDAHIREALIGTLIGVSVLSVTGVSGSSPSPRETVEGGIARVVAVLAPRPGESQSRAAANERRVRVQEILGSIVDFEEMSRRALGSHWGRLSPSEQSEFVDLFTRLLDRSYLGKIDQIVGLRMSFVSETIAGDEAIASWKIGQQSTELTPEYTGRSAGDTEIEFRLHRRDDRWRVYDLGVDSLRLVEIYRRQFTRVIQTESYPALVNRLLNKLDRAAAGIPRS